MLTACWEQCLQVMKGTDRCGRGGGDGGRAVVSAGRLAVRLCGRVQGHGVLGHPALPGVVLRRERVRRRKLCRDAILWGRRVLGGGVGLGHRFRRVGGLLVTLRETHSEKGEEIKATASCWACMSSMKGVRVPSWDSKGNRGELTCQASEPRGNSHHITSQLTLEEPLIIANEHSLHCRVWLTVRGPRVRGNLKAQEERSINWSNFD